MRWEIRCSMLLGACVLAFVMPAPATQKIKDTGPKYDTASEVKIKGIVEDITEVPGNFDGVHLLVRTDTGMVTVRVAPSAFLKEIDTSFKKGDQVQVTGAKAVNATDDQILAREITVGTNTLTLRDDQGIPVWAGWSPAGK